ncbi:hypothetical protein VHP8226_00136 [Vibrio hippocampi]|uniref:Uncharacterized protein n=1 Tax=Vibrio hippocampi TaxID=654686 RepID=A0ABM8ZE75_9VIBR|nr:hypothetical protein VHP8226_00136 [Vibrio hippocampi]
MSADLNVNCMFLQKLKAITLCLSAYISYSS